MEEVLPVVATVGGVLVGFVACTAVCVTCRIWRRNRYYKKVQHSLEDEERAFQETLSRNYADDTTQLDGDDKEKLQMLESYMASMDETDTERADEMPTKVEDVDKFMQDLAAAASGSSSSRPTI